MRTSRRKEKIELKWIEFAGYFEITQPTCRNVDSGNAIMAELFLIPIFTTRGVIKLEQNWLLFGISGFLWKVSDLIFNCSSIDG